MSGLRVGCFGIADPLQRASDHCRLTFYLGIGTTLERDARGKEYKSLVTSMHGYPLWLCSAQPLAHHPLALAFAHSILFLVLRFYRDTMAILRAHPTGQIVSCHIGPKQHSPLTTSKEDGITEGYIFRSQRSRRVPISFGAIIPLVETFENPRYIRIEDQFSQPVAGNEIHDCKVVADGKVFFITAYWKEDGHKNMAVESAGRGLRWKGEIAVVQVGKLTPFYKRLRNPSSVNKAVAR